MNVLSLFDGMSCGQLALQRAGVRVENYIASEIDKYAIQITMKNFPETIQLGDISKIDIKRDFEKFSWPDLFIGGSPCQGFSFAGKGLNFNDPRSKLFFEYIRLKNELKPKYFLLENVRMKKEYQNIISEYMGIEPVEINSSLVSAQNRKRLYWTNIPFDMPEDKGIMLKDIIEKDVVPYSIHNNRSNFKNNGFSVSTEKTDSIRPASGGGHIPLIACIKNKGTYKIKNDKSMCLDANYFKGVDNHGQRSIFFCIKEATKKGYVDVFNGDFIDLTFINSKTRRGRMMKYKSNCLTAAPYKYCKVENNNFRLFTPIECERLQTVPDNYTAGVSNTQRYKMLGNGWTVDLIAHIFKSLIDK